MEQEKKANDFPRSAGCYETKCSEVETEPLPRTLEAFFRLLLT